jgi:hypothetical protein
MIVAHPPHELRERMSQIYSLQSLCIARLVLRIHADTFRNELHDEGPVKGTAYGTVVLIMVTCSNYTVQLLGQIQPDALKIEGGYKFAVADSVNGKFTVADASGKFTMVKNKT